LATINDDGNLIDASALAAILALLTARMPEYDEKEEKVNAGALTDEKIPLKLENMPLTFTFFKIGDKIFVDPTREEEDTTEARLTIEISKPGKEEMINAMQKGGEVPISAEEIEIMIDEARKMFKKLSSLVEEEVKKFDKENKTKKGKKE
jgi:exosome complex component RRP42